MSDDKTSGEVAPKTPVEPAHTDDKKSGQVADTDLDKVAGGLNPQPLPPRISH